MTQVADTIRAQVGQQAFVMMGAKHLMAAQSGLVWKVGANPKSVTHVSVALAADDTYTVTFARVTAARVDRRTGKLRGGAKKLSEVSGVYVECLRAVLSKGTGLYLSL